MEQIFREEQTYMIMIKKKWVAALLGAAFLPTISVGAAAESEPVTLRVAMECEHAPYNWAQEDDADGAVPIADSTEYAQGYDVMIAKRICEELGWELEVMEFDQDALVPVVVSGTADCAISAQQKTEQWQDLIDVTDAYYDGSEAVLIRAEGSYAGAMSLEDLAGATCTALANSVWYKTCLAQIPDVQIADAKNSVPDLLNALKKEKCDAIVLERQEAAAALEEYPEFMMLDLSALSGKSHLTSAETAFVITVSQDNEELKTAINGVLDSITEEERQQMMQDAQTLVQSSKEEEQE
jgi:putative lysine transport system substrate-binding protein